MGKKICLTIGGISLAFLVVIGTVNSGIQALYGISLGGALAAFSIWSLDLLTRSFLNVETAPKEGVQRTVLVGLLKLPLMLAFIFFGTRLSQGGIACFLLAIGLVYSTFVAWWALSNA